MGTKTEEYLRILAEGGDAPADCCMTNEQKLIAEAIERINSIGGGETLTINIGSTTYEYDGSEPVTITILDGENTEF